MGGSDESRAFRRSGEWQPANFAKVQLQYCSPNGAAAHESGIGNGCGKGSQRYVRLLQPSRIGL